MLLTYPGGGPPKPGGGGNGIPGGAPGKPGGRKPGEDRAYREEQMAWEGAVAKEVPLKK